MQSPGKIEKVINWLCLNKFKFKPGPKSSKKSTLRDSLVIQTVEVLFRA